MGRQLGVPIPSLTDYVCSRDVSGAASSSDERKHHDLLGAQRLRGVNLGGWMVLQPWITPSLFYQFEGKPRDRTAFDMHTFCTVLGAGEGNRQLREHWQRWVTEESLHDLAQQGINAVRIPVGDWMWMPYDPYIGCALSRRARARCRRGPSQRMARIGCCGAGGTRAPLRPTKPSAARAPTDRAVARAHARCAEGAMDELWRVIRLCERFGLMVVIDLHAVRHSQNGFDNSGHAQNVTWSDNDHFSHWPVRSAGWQGAFDPSTMTYTSISWDNIRNTVQVHPRAPAPPSRPALPPRHWHRRAALSGLRRAHVHGIGTAAHASSPVVSDSTSNPLLGDRFAGPSAHRDVASQLPLRDWNRGAQRAVAVHADGRAQGFLLGVVLGGAHGGAGLAPCHPRRVSLRRVGRLHARLRRRRARHTRLPGAHSHSRAHTAACSRPRAHGCVLTARASPRQAMHPLPTPCCDPRRRGSTSARRLRSWRTLAPGGSGSVQCRSRRCQSSSGSGPRLRSRQRQRGPIRPRGWRPARPCMTVLCWPGLGGASLAVL